MHGTTVTDEAFRADGATYSPVRDRMALADQMRAVMGRMADGRWHTLPELEAELGCSSASISARIRDLRKERYGRQTIERRIRKGEASRTHEYRWLEQVLPGEEDL